MGGAFAQSGPGIAGFDFDLEGFRVLTSEAKFEFPDPIRKMRMIQKTPNDEVWEMDSPRPGEPSRLRVHPFGEGFDLYFERGFAFRVDSLKPPYLSWAEGSTGEEVLTPEADYHLVSFQSDLPPLLLTYPGAKTTVKVTGEEGRWAIRSGTPFKGWIRVIAPFGPRPWPATDAAGLGAHVAAMAPEVKRYTQHAAKLIGFRGARTAKGLVVLMNFDADGAILPRPIFKALDPGFRRSVILQTKTVRTNPNRPMRIEGRTLRVLFPNSRWYPGRALCSVPANLSRIDPFSPQEVANLAMVSMLSSRSRESRQLAFRVLNTFAQRFPGSEPELFSNTAPPALVAANCWLAQVVAPQARAKWIETLLGMDRFEFDFEISDETEARRTMAMAALALAAHPEPDKQAFGALLDLALVGREEGPGARPLSDLRSQAFGESMVMGPFNTPSRQITGQPFTFRIVDGRLETPKLDLAPLEALLLALPPGVGPLNKLIRSAPRQWEGISLWIAKAPEKERLKGIGIIGPAPRICDAVPVYGE